VPQNHPQVEPAHVTMGVGCAYTGDSRSTMYDAISEGKVQAVKEGRRLLLVFASLKKRVESRKPAVIGRGDQHFKELRSRVKHVGGKRQVRSRKKVGA
jgi:hypothetical protein